MWTSNGSSLGTSFSTPSALMEVILIIMPTMYIDETPCYVDLKMESRIYMYNNSINPCCPHRVGSDSIVLLVTLCLVFSQPLGGL